MSSEGERLQMDWTCPICKANIKRLVRVGHLLMAEPCTHAVLDLRIMPWFAERYAINLNVEK